MRDGRKGYILEIDANYPTELHGKHNDLPFMAKKIEIDKMEKLVPNLYNKDKYKVHGLVLKKVHRVISFQQCAWLKVYTDKNTKLKKKAAKAKNNFEKNFFKDHFQLCASY